MATEPTDNTTRRRFELHVDGELAALITYGKNSHQIALTHTETEPGFEGQGYAKQLVEFALAQAREAGSRCCRFCPYVRDYIAKHPEQLDLVPADVRPKFALAEA